MLSPWEYGCQTFAHLQVPHEYLDIRDTLHASLLDMALHLLEQDLEQS